MVLPDRRGLLRCVSRDTLGSTRNIIGHPHQRLERIPCKDILELEDARFEFFVSQVFPKLRLSMAGHTLIYIPSYFNYVRVRNYLNQEEIPFCSCSEYVDWRLAIDNSQRTESPLTGALATCYHSYTSNSDISRARSNFFHGKRPFMLYTERFHFFHRYRIRGVHNVVFYNLPQNPQFYSEVVNMVQSESSEGRVYVPYSIFDALELRRIFGARRARQFLQDSSAIHMLSGSG
jgi:U3 small nucleolar RNA-associated protein 25